MRNYSVSQNFLQNIFFKEKMRGSLKWPALRKVECIISLPPEAERGQMIEHYKLSSGGGLDAAT